MSIRSVGGLSQSMKFRISLALDVIWARVSGSSGSPGGWLAFAAKLLPFLVVSVTVVGEKVG